MIGQRSRSSNHASGQAKRRSQTGEAGSGRGPCASGKMKAPNVVSEGAFGPWGRGTGGGGGSRPADHGNARTWRGQRCHPWVSGRAIGSVDLSRCFGCQHAPARANGGQTKIHRFRAGCVATESHADHMTLHKPGVCAGQSRFPNQLTRMSRSPREAANVNRVIQPKAVEDKNRPGQRDLRLSGDLPQPGNAAIPDWECVPR